MRDKAELLLEIDDIVVTLTVDIRMGFKRKKLSNVELADMDEDTRVHIKEILDGVNSSRDFNKVVDQLLHLPWTQVVTQNMNDQDKEILKTHLVRYLEAFQTENAEYKIEKTYRYAREGYQGAKIVAGKEVKKGAKINSLRGATAPISPEQEKALGDRGVDTSCVIWSQVSKCQKIISGPTCFINHDCDPNCKWFVLPKGEICFEATRRIEEGEEMTIDYGSCYFGRDNKDCQCWTCEVQKKGWFKKRKRGERKDRDLYNEDEEKRIVKYLLKNGGWCVRRGALIWKELESKNVLEGRSWQSMRGRFLKHVVGNLKKHKTTEEKMVEADKKSGRTWKQRVDYLGSEDEDILDYIIEEQAYSRTGGKALFKEMAAKKVVEGRTWRSLHDRFIHIKKNLNDYDFLTEEQKTCLSERKSIFDEDGKLAAGQTMKSRKFLDSEDRDIIDFIIDNQAYSRVGSWSLFKEMEEAGVVQGRNWRSLRSRFQSHIGKNIDSFGLTPQQVADIKNKTIPAGQTMKNQKFSEAEDRALLGFIINKQAYSRVGSPSLYKEMEEAGVVQGRDWRSLKNHFQSHIRKNIDSFGLTAQQVADFKNKTIPAGQTMKNQTFSEAEDRAMIDFIIEKQAYSRVGSRSLYKEMAKAGVVQGRDWKSLKDRFQKHIWKNIDSFKLTAQQVADFKNKTIPAGQTRKNQKYSVEEDKELLQYIVKKKAYNEVGGRTLWKKMEKKGLVNGRPSESMRNRFYNTLIKNIKEGKENYGLTQQEISWFRGEGKVEDGGEKEGESTDSDDDDDEEEMDIDVEEEEGDIDEPEVEEKDDEKGEEGDEQGENEEEVDRPLPSRILVDF